LLVIAPARHRACPSSRLPAALASARHRSEQNFTASQSRIHLRRQAKASLQQAHGLLGRSAFFRMRATVLLLTMPTNPGRAATPMG
jgi:hypothetical protein